MGIASARHIAAICAAFQLVAGGAGVSAQQPKNHDKLYYDCVVSAAKRLSKSKEAADVVAEAALADPECSFDLLMIEMSRDGAYFSRTIQQMARRAAISTVMESRISPQQKR